MDNAVATAPLPAQIAAPNFVARLAALPPATRMKFGVGIAALIAVVAAMLLWSARGDWRVLYAGLPDKDAGAVLAQLATLNVPYRLTDGGAAIMVPAERMADVRMKLATAGLPKSGVSGCESMDKPSFGKTQFQERMDFQGCLESKLRQTITSLQAVEDARIHLALPNQNGFFREQQMPSASVMLQLRAGRTLDKSQVAGIVHLVSSSVPQLSPKAVSVLDQSGSLLSGPADESPQGLDSKQLEYVAQVESGYLKRVQEILEPVLGRDNLRATVTAEVDFSQSEATSELYKPNQGGQPATVRSQQTSESGSAAALQPSGVPGASSNQPPTPATAPINGASAPLQGAQGGTSGGNLRRDATTNFEVDKTVRVTRNATGTVKRLNTAVLVNHRTETDAKGKSTTKPLSPEEMDKLTALVQEAIGYNKERGDSVKVVNAPFKIAKPESVEAPPIWEQPWLVDLVRAGAAPGALALVALAIVFGLIKPALQQARAPIEPARGQQVDAVVDDAHTLPEVALPALESPVVSVKLEQARQLARENPGAVAEIMRNWVGGAST